MLRLMRKHARAWFMQVLLGIIIIVFIFYFGSLRRQREAEALAIVKDTAISYLEFKKEYQNLLDHYRQHYKGTLTDEMLESLNIKQLALDNVINQAVLLAKAEEFNLDVSADEVRSTIFSYPAFQQNGVFDINLYHRMLRYNRLNPEDFEDMQRKVLIIGKLERLIKEATKVSDKEVYDIYRIQNETISVDFITISADTFKTRGNPSDTDLGNYLKEHGEDFRIPSKVQVKYMAFFGKDFAKSVEISEGEISDYYDYNKSDFLKSKDEPYPLTEVKDKIRAKVKFIKGMDKAAKAAKEANDIIYQEENFEEYGNQNKLTIKTTAFFSKDTLPEELSRIKDFDKHVFVLKENETASLLSDDQGFYIVKINKIEPSHIPDLKEARKEIQRSYINEERMRLCKETAEGIIDRLKKGENFEEIARQERLKVKNTGLFLPNPDIPGIGYSMDLAQELFLLSEKEPYPDKPFYINGSYVIVRFKGRGTLDLKDLESRKDILGKTLLRVKGEEQFRLWLDTTKDSMIKDGTLKIKADLNTL
ncbi:MAG: SurA N-terminal domain-containing protein [Deltaproteobacteria bacterium]|nr:SurA N-terminal domain-containing protein [Deltaproteobacteria bacterium]